MSKLTPGKEYERKFLARVKLLPDFASDDAEPIEQGYLALSPNRIRIRLKGSAYVVELKGGDDDEIELYRPSRADGHYLLHSVASKVASIVVKDRVTIAAGFDDLNWEIDFFRKDNAPLVVVELETPTKRYPLKLRRLPEWIGKEVTDDPRFKNSNLALRPFSSWKKSEQKEVLKLMGA